MPAEAVTTETSAAARLKAASDPLRLRMGLLMFDDGHTVKELAETLNVPATRLYYHMKILEQHGLVEVVERRMVSGIEERRYRAVDDAWAFADSEMTGSAIEQSGVIRAVFGAVQAEIEVAVHAKPDEELGLTDSAVPVLTLTDLIITRDELIEVQEALNALNRKFAIDRPDPPAGGERYHFLFAGWKRPEVASAS